MKFLKIFLIALGAVVLLFLSFNFFLPSDYHFSREIEIKSELIETYNLINHVKNWEKWSPWKEKDPNALIEYAGSASGIGASFSWKSKNENVGNGKITIVDVKILKSISLSLDFEHMKGSEMEFNFAEKNGKVFLKWDFDSKLGFFMRWTRFFMDKMLSVDFEKGLKNIKKICESVPPLKLEISETLVHPMNLLYVTDSTSHSNPDEISKAFEKAYNELSEFIAKGKLTMTGPPLAINLEYKNKYIFDACFPIKENEVKPAGRIKIKSIPETRAILGMYTGSYDNLEKVYEKLMNYIEFKKLIINGFSWEQYINDPQNTPKEKLRTNIYFPIK